MQKNFLAALAICVCLIGAWSMPEVHADAIWEPSDDFYWNHAAECEYVGKDYMTNGREGYVTLYKEPNSDEAVARIKNGKRFYVGFSWTDKAGEVWAVMSFWGFEPEEGELFTEGVRDAWLPLDELAELYSEADFRADYEDTFEEYTDEMQGYEIKKAIYLWEYPGSEVNKGWIESYMQPGEEPVYKYLYTDPDGRRWTYIGYYYSHRGWVCIDEPESEVIEKSYELEVVKDENGVQTKQDALGIAGASVAGLVAITAALIAVLFGKKKEKSGKGEK